jgi:hypothetical protein
MERRRRGPRGIWSWKPRRHKFLQLGRTIGRAIPEELELFLGDIRIFDKEQLFIFYLQSSSSSSASPSVSLTSSSSSSSSHLVFDIDTSVSTSTPPSNKKEAGSCILSTVVAG